MPTALFFTPHQDDEALTFGQGIRSHLDAGHDVHVVLYTDGRSSVVRHVLNGAYGCPLHQCTHHPAGEGYEELDEDAFVDARDDEFGRACRALGVPNENVHLAPGRMRDGHSTVDGCAAVLVHFLNRFPGASLRVTTDIGGNHPDHASMGAAARELSSRVARTDVRYYVEPYQLANVREAAPSLRVSTEVSQANGTLVVSALEEYGKWDPQRRRFAIGRHSVHEAIDQAMTERSSYFHR